MFIPDPRKGWNNYAIKEAKKIIEEHSISTIITTSPPHSTQLIGLALKRELGVNWIADLRDPWTDIFYYKDLLHLPIRAKKDKKLETAVLENADQVITVSKAIKTLFSTKLSSNSDKIHVIPNGFDPNDFTSKEEQKNELFTLGYIGSLTEEYSPKALFEALKKLKEKYTFRIKFVGNISPGIKAIIHENDLDSHCTFKDRLAHDEAVKEMQSSDALLLFIPKVVNNEGILTGKIFEYIATKKPVIGIGPENGDAAEILLPFSSSKMFDYSSSEIESFLEDLFKKKQDNSVLESVGDHMYYSRKNQASQVAEIIKSF